MTSPALATTIKGKGRHYTHPHTATPVPSVTNILNIIAKPALPRWAAKVVAEQAAAMRHSLPALEQAEIVDMLKGAPWRSSTRSADRGTNVHGWLEAALRGHATPDLEGPAAQYQPAAAEWMRNVGDHLDVQEVEQTVFHDAYAGTADLLALIDGELTVIDFKTSKAIYPEAALQLAALGACTIMPDGERRQPATAGIAVRIGVDGRWEEKKVRSMDGQHAAFMHALKLWEWQHEAAYA